MPRGVPAGQLTLQVLAKGEGFSVTPAVSGIPTASERGRKSELAHLWAKWLCHPCRLGDPHRFRAGGGIRIGPQVGKVATSPLPSRGSPPLQSGGAKSKVAHKCAKWLRHPCRFGDPHRFRAGGQNHKWPTSGQSGFVTRAVSGIPTRAGGGDQNWPTSGQSGFLTPAVSGIPDAAERGGKIISGPLVGKVATSPLPSRGSPPEQGGGGIRIGPQMGKVATSPMPSRGSPPERGGEIESGPLSGKVATSPLPSRGSPPLQSSGQNQKGPQVGMLATSLLLSRGSPPLHIFFLLSFLLGKEKK